MIGDRLVIQIRNDKYLRHLALTNRSRGRTF